MQKYVGFKKLEIKKTYKDLNMDIANLSDKTGIPQWQLRSKIKRDFDIDI